MQKTIKLGLALVGLYAMAVVASWWMYDLSWDGQAYHQEAIIQLMNGWNPFHQPTIPFKLQGDGYNIWVEHYAKGSWLCAASLAKLTGSIECGKAFGLLLFIASLLLTYSVIRDYIPRKWHSALFASLLSASPVVVSQLGTYYVDGPRSSLTLVLLALIWHSIKRSSIHTLLPLASTAVLLVNTKFNGLVDVCMMALAVFVIACVCRRQMLRSVVITLCGAIVVGAAVVGYQPYVVNTLQHGHPLYPVMGPKKVDVIERQINSEFAAKNQLYKTIYSLFAYTENNLQTYPVLKTPWTLSQSEVDTMAAFDVRIGGFGPLYGLVLSSSLILVLLAFFSMKSSMKGAGPMGIGACASLITGFANPEAWWARFSPQIWFIAPLFLMVVIVGASKTWLKGIGWALIFFLAVNTLISSWSVANANIPANIMLRTQLRNLADYTKDHPPVVAVFHYFPSNRIRLNEAGVKWREASGLQPANVAILARSDTMIIMY